MPAELTDILIYEPKVYSKENSLLSSRRRREMSKLSTNYFREAFTLAREMGLRQADIDPSAVGRALKVFTGDVEVSTVSGDWDTTIRVGLVADCGYGHPAYAQEKNVQRIFTRETRGAFDADDFIQDVGEMMDYNDKLLKMPVFLRGRIPFIGGALGLVAGSGVVGAFTGDVVSGGVAGGFGCAGGWNLGSYFDKGDRYKHLELTSHDGRNSYLDEYYSNYLALARLKDIADNALTLKALRRVDAALGQVGLYKTKEQIQYWWSSNPAMEEFRREYNALPFQVGKDELGQKREEVLDRLRVHVMENPGVVKA